MISINCLIFHPDGSSFSFFHFFKVNSNDLETFLTICIAVNSALDLKNNCLIDLFFPTEAISIMFFLEI